MIVRFFFLFGNLLLLLGGPVKCNAESYQECSASRHLLPCSPQPLDPSLRAYEVISPLNGSIYVATPDSILNSPINDQLFASWSPNWYWQKNNLGVRVLTFQQSCVFSSPRVSDLQEPWARADWFYLANFLQGRTGLGGCFPQSCAGLLGKEPREGSLKYVDLSKCHVMGWSANTSIVLLHSPRGEKFILHARDRPGVGLESFAHHVYPEGWTLSTEVLHEDFFIVPEMRDDIPFYCMYNILRDSDGNSFHRITKNTNELPENFHPILFGYSPVVVLGYLKTAALCAVGYSVLRGLYLGFLLYVRRSVVE